MAITPEEASQLSGAITVAVSRLDSELEEFVRNTFDPTTILPGFTVPRSYSNRVINLTCLRWREKGWNARVQHCQREREWIIFLSPASLYSDTLENPLSTREESLHNGL